MKKKEDHNVIFYLILALVIIAYGFCAAECSSPRKEKTASAQVEVIK